MDRLTKDLEQLRNVYPDAVLERRPDGSAFVSIPNFVLKTGWNRASVTVRFIAPVGYPLAQPDCFWTDRDLLLASGGPPMNSAENTGYGGAEPLRWFSYHVGTWRPNGDTLLTYAKLISKRLGEAK